MSLPTYYSSTFLRIAGRSHGGHWYPWAAPDAPDGLDRSDPGGTLPARGVSGSGWSIVHGLLHGNCTKIRCSPKSFSDGLSTRKTSIYSYRARGRFATNMELYPASYPLIVVGIVLFAMGKRPIFLGVVFATPFRKVLIANFPGFTGYSLTFPHFFLMLFMVRKAVNVALRERRISLRFQLEKLLLLGVLVTAVMSLSMPLFFAEGTPIHPFNVPQDYTEYVWQPLTFNSTHVTQLMYLLFFVISYWMLIGEMTLSRNQLKTAVKVLILGGVLAVGTGYFSNICVWLDAQEFRDLILDPFNPTLDYGWSSFYYLPLFVSLIGEPGYTGQYAALLLGLLLVPFLLGKKDFYWNPVPTYLLIVYFSFAALLGGTTGYLTLAATFAFVLVFLLPKMSLGFFVTRSLRYTLYFLVPLIVFAQVYGLYADRTFMEMVQSAHIDKIVGEAGSGTSRLRYALDALDLTLQYPILGVGWGSNRAPNLLMTVFSQIGILGGSLFLAFNGTVLWQGFSAYSRLQDPNRKILVAAVVCSFFGVFLGSLLGQPIGTINFVWYRLLLAMLTGAYYWAYAQQTLETKPETSDPRSLSR